jgi:hypothetical protein
MVGGGGGLMGLDVCSIGGGRIIIDIYVTRLTLRGKDGRGSINSPPILPFFL